MVITKYKQFFTRAIKNKSACYESKPDVCEIPETAEEVEFFCNDEFNEEKDSRKSKRGRYYKVTKKLIDQENNQIDTDNQFEENPCFSNTFSSYMLDNWVGLAPLWRKFLIGGQLKHLISAPYTTSSSTHKGLDSVTTPLPPLHKASMSYIISR